MAYDESGLLPPRTPPPGVAVLEVRGPVPGFSLLSSTQANSGH